MSRDYSACVVYGVKVKIKVTGYPEVTKIALGDHDLSRKAVKLAPDKLKSCGFSGVSQFRLVCDHVD